MYFPIADIHANPYIIFFVAFIVSFFTSMGGISGAFLLLPFQMSFLGYTSPSVSATNHVFNIIAIPSGVYRYIKEKRMLWPLARAIIIGTLPGVFIGAWVRIEYLPDPKNFKVFAGIVLLYIGWKLFKDVFLSKTKAKNNDLAVKGIGFNSLAVLDTSLKKVSFTFQGKLYAYKPASIYLICFFVGIIGGIYGIGGGSIIAPMLVTIIGLPVHVIAGAALLGTFVTSISGVIFYQFLAGLYPQVAVSPDWMLGALFGSGGFLGMYMGARVQKHVQAVYIKGILTFCILFIAIKYIAAIFVQFI
ncbi:MAG: sulfite exporter TauE/SafE family protein [Deltaproteobacteria bacterium]|uniref:sulfite exporter TauE/SafE family protein n=1 Tax=Desulfobacula sp. TaxID=2593537 RepID=UPI0019CCDC93|nr:sulfite exporter TauE/SafE family protein [Candidatus Desulfobacula maris]MBL6995040.1 sulfite exporter TauE/SafE family protein [Desulfobacula sp.]